MSVNRNELIEIASRYCAIPFAGSIIISYMKLVASLITVHRGKKLNYIC